ncbi:MAG: MCE family protein [Ignavibacteria bacterium]|nr:MCE family protein [Ignavibacteria bacterium]
MTSKRSTEIKVGIVSLLSLIILIIGISLGRGWIVSGTQQIISMKFPSSGGIDVSSSVMVNGVKRGTVLSVKNDKSGVLVQAAIDDISDFHSDISARISMLEITGGKKIDLAPGIAGTFNPQSEIKGTIATDATELIAMVGDLGTDARILIKRLDTITAAATNLLADGKVVAQMREAIDNTNQLVIGLNTFIQQNKPELQATLNNLKALSVDLRQAVQVNEPKVRELLGKLDATTISVQNLITKTDGTLNNADGLITDVRKTVNDLKTGSGVVTKLLYDKEFSVKLDSTIIKLHDFIDKAYEHGVNVNLRLGTRP